MTEINCICESEEVFFHPVRLLFVHSKKPKFRDDEATPLFGAWNPVLRLDTAGNKTPQSIIYAQYIIGINLSIKSLFFEGRPAGVKDAEHANSTSSFILLFRAPPPIKKKTKVL